MKIVFISNYYNHHQAPFCQAMYAHLGDDFTFVQTEEMEEERMNMGWKSDYLPLFVQKSYGDLTVEEKCRKLIDDADVVIIGSAPNTFVRNRIKTGKIVIRYSERQLKKGRELWKYPYRYLKWHIRNPRNANVYLLCASAYAASDYAQFGLFQGKSYRWGYFPEVKRYPDICRLIADKRPASILWVARMIKWKHPELPVLVAQRLMQENIPFEMTLIGGGKLEPKIQKMIRKLGLENHVKMLGVMTPEQVREYMEQSQIFMFTSDRNEGWGAVLNESMNSGCAVVADRAIGATPFLLNDGENGLIYDTCDVDGLYERVKYLLDHPDEARKLGRRAYETITEEWNAETAAQRLLELCESLLEDQRSPDLYKSGPCSRAEILKD